MTLRPTWMEVRLDNVRANYRAIRDHILAARQEGAPVPRVFSVIKANAYNLGALPVAWALRREGADFFIVATADEAVELRRGGITVPVLVLGASPYDAAEEYVRQGIRASITDMEMARAMSAASEKIGKKAIVHLKVDTGMGRIGFSPEEVVEKAARVASLPGIVCEGIFTHFAAADEEDLAYTEKQHDAFLAALEALEKGGIHIPLKHCCNSGGTLSYPEWAMDGVRAGQILAGMYPTPEVPRSIPILPGFSFRTRIGALRTLPAGKTVSYGMTYTTTSEERMAVLPVGYADGFARNLSNRADVLIRGVRCPVAGRICMDQCMVNVSALPEAAVGDEAVLIGRQGNEEITIYEYAEKMDTIVAAIGAIISPRVPRVYRDDELGGES